MPCRENTLSIVELFKERKEGVERETTRRNDANMMAESVCEDKGHDIRRTVTEEATDILTSNPYRWGKS